MENQKERLEAYRKALDEAFKAASDPTMDERTNRMLERLDARIEADSARRRRLWNVAKPLSAVACLSVVAILVWRKHYSESLPVPSGFAYENNEGDVRRVSLPVENATITGTSTSGDALLGGFIGNMGTAASGLSFSSCHTKGVTVKSNNNGAHVGGFVGRGGNTVGSGTISKCYAEEVTVSGGNYTGGFAGSLRTNLEKSYSTGTVNAYGGATGGLVGYLNGRDCTVNNCYSWVSVKVMATGKSDISSLVGNQTAGTKVQRCYINKMSIKTASLRQM